jgi:hypothetical protein
MGGPQAVHEGTQVVIRRRELVIAGIAAVVIGLITLGAAILSTGGGGSSLPGGAPFAVTSSLNPNVVYFGDPLTARIDIAVDTRKVDPDRLRIATNFGPFDRLAQHKLRRDAGRITYIRETYRLRCLSRQCVQLLPSVAAAAGGAKPSGRRATQFPPARVYVQGSSSVQPILLQWPTVESVTRVNQAESQLQTFFYHADLTPPARSYALSPSGVLWLLFVAVLVLAAVPTTLAVRRWREYRRAHGPAPGQELAPLERALRLLEWANRQPEGSNRRRALELVALELLRGGRADLVDEARALAWSPPSPPPEEAGRLGTRVRTATGSDGANSA